MAKAVSKVLSRKLLSILGAIGGIVGLWLGMAQIDSALVVELQTQLVEISVLIAGLGGYNAYRQGTIDEAAGGEVDG